MEGFATVFFFSPKNSLISSSVISVFFNSNDDTPVTDTDKDKNDVEPNDDDDKPLTFLFSCFISKLRFIIFSEIIHMQLFTYKKYNTFNQS